jgi:hypothetical protein
MLNMTDDSIVERVYSNWHPDGWTLDIGKMPVEFRPLAIALLSEENKEKLGEGISTLFRLKREDPTNEQIYDTAIRIVCKYRIPKYRNIEI